MKMKPVTILILCLVLLGLALALPGRPAQALPEYSSQTGEPCATCHASPSGGGVRTPRGQAWVAQSKPGEVPDLVAALDALGVSLDVNEADYVLVPDTIAPAAALSSSPAEASSSISREVQRWIAGYGGN
ncbi:MAG TPA: hypothetical protein VN363_02845 [Anaerolineales bacterium]|nr:hypothetical protein [Anaerolineales bacterium]